MTLFRYSAYTSSGEVQNGQLEAKSADDAVHQLHERGLLPFDTEQVHSNAKQERLSSPYLNWNRLSIAEWANFTQGLAVLMQAELPLDESLRLMMVQSTSKKSKLLCNALLEDVISGNSLSESLNKHAEDAPSVMFAMLRAGEARGNIGSALRELAKFLSTRAEIREKIRSSLTYPLILVVTAFLSIAIIVAVLVPALMPIFEDTGTPLPSALLFASILSQILRDYWVAIIFIAVAVLVLLNVALRYEKTRYSCDEIILRLPLVGALIKKVNVGLFARSLGTLLANGVTLIPAMKVAGSVVSNRVIARHLNVAVSSIREGSDLTSALNASGVVPETAIRFIAIGEEASRLDAMLLHLADLFDKETQRRLEKITTLLSPAITLLIGLLVGGLILSVMQAILSINELAFQ